MHFLLSLTPQNRMVQHFFGNFKHVFALIQFKVKN